MLAILSWIILILCGIHVFFNYNAKARLLRLIPGPEIFFIIGNMPLIFSTSSADLMKLGVKLANQFNGIYRFWSFPYGAISIYNPDDIETILGNSKYNEKSFIYTFLKPWLGDGLLLSSGEKWQQRRKILTPAFHFNILRQFYSILEENGQRLVNSLDKIAGKPVDIVPILSEYTLNSICETAMGTKLSEETTGAGKTYKQTIYEIGTLFFQRFISLYLYVDAIYFATPSGKKALQKIKILHGFTRRVINDRKKHIEQYGIKINEEVQDSLNDNTFMYKKKRKIAMLDLLLAARKDGEIDDAGIQEEVDTFMFEGHDTTASGLTFCFMIIANHKQIQDKIVDELNEIFGGSDRPATTEDLSKMQYLECCIKESLRLYPPVHFISRNLKESTQLSNFTIPAGVFCHIHISDLHRRPDLFEDPLAYNPDRFLPENSIGRHPYSYIPFSAGPRNCIGQKFAMMEMKSAVSEVLRKFELHPVTRPSEIEYLTDIVLRNSGPVKVTFVKRQ